MNRDIWTDYDGGPSTLMTLVFWGLVVGAFVLLMYLTDGGPERGGSACPYPYADCEPDENLLTPHSGGCTINPMDAAILQRRLPCETKGI